MSLPLDTGLGFLSENEDRLSELASELWAIPETAHREWATSRLLSRRLADAGFEIEMGVASLPTAFVASYGEGRPRLGIVALLDALPGLSQAHGVTMRQPVVEGGAGHGCGHNLLAAGSLGAALALAETIEAQSLAGTIRFYGAPAEEIYHGGVYMIREGLFSDLDALLFWHPSAVTTVISRSGLAMDSLRYVFHGRASDATDAAALGRNAVTALELFASSARRQDWPPPSVVNHVIASGGDIPSVVPERATIWFFLHGKDREQVDALRSELTGLAEAVAATTETRLEVQVLSRTRNWLVNRALAELLDRKLREEEPPSFSDDERALAAALRHELTDEAGDFFEKQVPLDFGEEPVPISDDTADASWVTPRGGFLIACFPAGTPSHTWQWTASAASSFAIKGMMRASRVLVRTGVELLTRPATLEKVRDEFETQTEGRPYESPLGPESGPFDYLLLPKRPK